MCIIMPLTILIWVALYWPWVYFTQLSLGTSSTNYVALLCEYSLGLVIALGNAMVGFAATLLMDYYGFRHVGHQQIAYLIVIVPAVLLNVVADFMVSAYVSLSLTKPELMSESSFYWSFGVGAWFSDIYNVLIPGYILVPYIGEPIATVLLTFWVGRWRVGVDRRINRSYAERIMVSAEVDIINPPYCDLICTSAAFFVTFHAPSSDHWSLFLCLVAWSVFLYAQNRYRILRWQSYTYFSTNLLDHCETYLWALPLGFLASSWGFQMFYDHGDGIRGILAFLFFVGHVFFHWVSLAVYNYLFGMQLKKVTSESFSMAVRRHPAAATYRNTNPVEVLKSRMGPSRDALTFYKVGKDYLQSRGDQKYLDDDTLFLGCCPIFGARVASGDQGKKEEPGARNSEARRKPPDAVPQLQARHRP